MGGPVRLDERGAGHILDEKSCRGRMSKECEARNERRYRDTPSASADASHASEGFVQNRAYRSLLHSTAGKAANPREGQVYRELIKRLSEGGRSLGNNEVVEEEWRGSDGHREHDALGIRTEQLWYGSTLGYRLCSLRAGDAGSPSGGGSEDRVRLDKIERKGTGQKLG